MQTKFPLKNIIARNWPLALFCLIHAAIVLCIFQSNIIYDKLYILRSGFDTCEYNYASQCVDGAWPYRDFSVEYPPITMIFIVWPTLIVSGFSAYLQVYAVEVLLLDLVALFLLKNLSGELGYNPWKNLGIYTLALLAVGPLILTRLDFVPAIITLLSIFFFVKRHSKTAWAFLAAAILTKVYPAVLVPVFLLIQINRKQKGELLEGLAVFVITAAVIASPFILMSESGFWDSLLYHAQRPLQIESTYASIIELLYAFNIFDLSFTNSANSLVVTSPVADMLAKISFGIMVLSLLAVYWSLYRKLQKGQLNRQDQPDRAVATALTFRYCLISVLVFILTSKVFSPQYIIWLLPLIPLIQQKGQNIIWILFIIVGVMTFFIFPQYYDGIKDGSLMTISLLVVRNVTLIGMVLLLIHGHILKTESEDRIKGSKQ